MLKYILSSNTIIVLFNDKQSIWIHKGDAGATCSLPVASQTSSPTLLLLTYSFYSAGLPTAPATVPYSNSYSCLRALALTDSSTWHVHSLRHQNDSLTCSRLLLN